MKKPTIITIDGPAGSGKSTVAALLAQRLNFGYLDTGAMYRAVTFAALQQHIDLDDDRALTDLTRRCQIEISVEKNPSRIKLDDADITDAIRSPHITDVAHKIARIPRVRQIMVARQRQIACQHPGMVTEGRDQGTVVFADADFKFYLDATAACRAQRRWRQVQDTPDGKNQNYETILQAQQQRDQRDTTRPVSPLKIPPDAVVIDTTDLTIEQVVQKLYQHVTEGKN